MASARGGEMCTHGPSRKGREMGGFTAAVSAVFCLDDAASVIFKLTGLPEHDLLCLNTFECDWPATDFPKNQAKNIHTHTHTLAFKVTLSHNFCVGVKQLF